MPDLILHRQPALVDRRQSYCVVVDDEVRAQIADGETVRIPVEPGPHVVQLTHDRVGSPRLTVEVDGDHRLSCKSGVPSGERVGLFFFMKALTFGRNEWVTLTDEEERPGRR